MSTYGMGKHPSLMGHMCVRVGAHADPGESVSNQDCENLVCSLLHLPGIGMLRFVEFV